MHCIKELTEYKTRDGASVAFKYAGYQPHIVRLHWILAGNFILVSNILFIYGCIVLLVINLRHCHDQKETN